MGMFTLIMLLAGEAANRYNNRSDSKRSSCRERPVRRDVYSDYGTSLMTRKPSRDWRRY